MIELDCAAAQQHIKLLTGSSTTPMCFRILGDNEPKNHYGTLFDFWPEICRRNLAGGQVYFVVNEGGNSAAEITRIRSLFIDMDGRPEPAEWHCEPDFIVRRDATHWHAYWLVDDMPVAGFTAAQQQLIAHYGSDPGIHDLPRVLRLAGTIHVKNPTKLHPENDGVPRLITVEETAQWETHRSAEVLAGLKNNAHVEQKTTTAKPNEELIAADQMRLAEAMRSIPNVDREWSEWNAIGMALFNASNRSDAGRDLWLEFCAKSNKYDEADALDRWQTWFRSPPGQLGAGTIYHYAQTERDKTMFADVEMPEPINPDDLFSTGKAHRERVVGPIEELIPGLIEKHCVTYLSGAGGLSKSRVAHHWGCCIHAGLEVYGRAVQQATFVHVSYENGPDEDARRHQTLLRKLAIDPEQLDDYVACNWKGREPLLDIGEPGDLRETALWGALKSKLLAIAGHKFVVFDSAYNVFNFRGSAKINETAVQRAIDWLDNQMAACDASGLFLMHPSSQGLKDGNNGGWSVAWLNRPRARLAFKSVKDHDDMVELSVQKRNNAERGRPIVLRWSEGMLIPNTSATEQLAILRAVVTVAIAASNGGTPLKKGGNAKQSGINSEVSKEIERLCGVRLTLAEIHAALARAAKNGYLIYQEYDKNKRASEAMAGYRQGKTPLDEPF